MGGVVALVIVSIAVPVIIIVVCVCICNKSPRTRGPRYIRMTDTQEATASTPCPQQSQQPPPPAETNICSIQIVPTATGSRSPTPTVYSQQAYPPAATYPRNTFTK